MKAIKDKVFETGVLSELTDKPGSSAIGYLDTKSLKINPIGRPHDRYASLNAALADGEKEIEIR